MPVTVPEWALDNVAEYLGTEKTIYYLTPMSVMSSEETEAKRNPLTIIFREGGEPTFRCQLTLLRDASLLKNYLNFLSS